MRSIGATAAVVCRLHASTKPLKPARFSTVHHSFKLIPHRDWSFHDRIAQIVFILPRRVYVRALVLEVGQGDADVASYALKRDLPIWIAYPLDPDILT